MSPESHDARMQGLFKALKRKSRDYYQRAKGKRAMPARVRKKIKKAHRIRKQLKVIKDLREIQNICRMNAVAAVERMVKIVENPTTRDSDAAAAAHFILDRAYGKATQTNLNANVDANGKSEEVTLNELDRRIKEALARVEELTGGARQAPASPQQPLDLRKLN